MYSYEDILNKTKNSHNTKQQKIAMRENALSILSQNVLDRHKAFMLEKGKASS